MSLFSNDEDPKKEDLLRELFGELPFGSSSVVSEAGIATAQDNAYAESLSDYLNQFQGRTPLNIMELTPEDEPRPSDLIGEDDVFEMLYAVMSGRQGVPEGTSEELLRELSSVLAGANQDQIDAIAQQILEAGSFDAWLSQRQETRQQELADRLAAAAEEGPDALQEALRDVLSDFGIDPTMTVADATQKAIDFIRKMLPENTPESILEDYIGAGIGVLWEDFGNITWQQGQILIPGLPGLPIPSGLIKVGEIQDLLNDPLGAISEWSSDIWNRVLSTVTDPAAVLGGLFGGYDDIPDGLASLILSGEVTQGIIDWYDSLNEDDEEDDDTTKRLPLGDDETDEDPYDPFEGDLPEDTGPLPEKRPAEDIGGGTVGEDEEDDDVLGETDPFEGGLPGATGPLPEKGPAEDISGGTVGEDRDLFGTGDLFEGDLPSATGPLPEKGPAEDISGGTVGEDEEEDDVETTPDTPDSGAAGGGGRGTRIEPMSFDPLGINYQPVQLQRLINPTYQDVLDQIIKRNSGMLTSPEDFLLS